MATRKPKTHPAAKPTKQQSPWLVPAIAIGIFIGVLAITVLLLVADQPTPFTPTVTGAPAIEVAQSFYDYGTVRYGEMVETVVRVRNMGDEPLFLEDPHVEVVEGCCPPQALVSSRSVWPGEEAIIRLEFTMHEGMGGPHDFRLHVRSNDPNAPEEEITILSNWVA